MLPRRWGVLGAVRSPGVDVRLVFGMEDTGRVGGRQFGQIGHCWLVKDDTPYLEARDPRSLFSEVCRRLPFDARSGA
jgi:hypothetical protein